jgi:hypothetical protein
MVGTNATVRPPVLAASDQRRMPAVVMIRFKPQPSSGRSRARGPRAPPITVAFYSP